MYTLQKHLAAQSYLFKYLFSTTLDEQGDENPLIESAIHTLRYLDLPPLTYRRVEFVVQLL